ncbi:MAG: hypothetical protein H7246_23540 [Phycisphaerae bacterium]|nr:hypothetical protein [Saprospiraceae bacterium]
MSHDDLQVPLIFEVYSIRFAPLWPCGASDAGRREDKFYPKEARVATYSANGD